MKEEFEKNFASFADYSRAQGASEQEIQEMKVGLLDSMIEASLAGMETHLKIRARYGLK